MKRTEDDIVLKLLHTADWHLGRRFPRFGAEAGKTLSRARRDVLERIFAEAERNQVDAVLCAGDLFDTPQPDDDFKAALLQVLGRLGWKNRLVFLLPGNHDPLVPESVWKDPSFKKALPDFVRIVDQELLEVALPNDCVLFAVPCRSRAGQGDPTASIPLRAAGDERVRIGLVHGSTFDAGDWKTNFPISKDAALERGLDYLAIGDTHGFRFVPPDRKVPPTIYPGTPEPTAFDEQDAGHVALVFINRARKAMVQKRPVGQWKWEELTVKSMDELRLLAMRADLASRVLRLTLDLRVSTPEYQEAEALLGKLEGSASTHAKVGVLELDREKLSLDLTDVETLSAGLPPVLQAAVKRLRLEAAKPEQRAALLLPSTSSVATTYVPWQENVTPVVTLTFLTDVAKCWRVVKRFGENDATLSFSKDGREFSVEAHERAVDEKLRKLLGWGIPAPGGRGGVKGMPDSFLANALLAAQTDVDLILNSSLEDDDEPGGKVKLTAALSALAQDPLVRHVLDAAQKEHELYFTTTGRKRGGQSAPLTLASDAVKKLTDELMVQQQALSQTFAIEQDTRRLHDAWLEAQQQVELAEQSLARAQAGLERGRAKRAAEENLASERKALAQVEVLGARVQTLEAQIAAAGLDLAQREATVEAAQAQVKAAAAALRDAEEAHRKASSAAGEAERAVARATLKEAQAKRSVERAELLSQLERAQAHRRATEALAKLTAEVTKLTTQLEPARATQLDAQGQVTLMSGILNYGQWRSANEAALQAEKSRTEARAMRADALKKTAEVLAVQKSAAALEEALVARREGLPDEKTRASLQKLRRDLDLAEASLGGGVTVVVRPKSSLLLRSTADENAPEEKKVMKEHVVEADRRVQLSIGDLVDIEVIAGAPEKRKDADVLKKRWKSDAVPALERAHVRNLGELDERFAQLGEEAERLEALGQNAAQLERDAEALRARSSMLEEKAAGAPTPEQLEARRRAVGELPFDVLAKGLESMGPSWEREVTQHQESTIAALAQATGLVTKLEAALQLTQARLSDAQEKRPVAAQDVAVLEQALAALERALANDTEQLNQLEEQGSGAQKQATVTLGLARQHLEALEAGALNSNEAVTGARALVSGLMGQRDATAAQLKDADGPALRARVSAAQQQLASFADVEVLAPSDFAQRERGVERARLAADQAGRDFANAEGALSKVGGPQAREQVRQLEEAVTVAKTREHLLEVDAAAWRLLVEAVREAEKEDSSSLGTALSGPVTARFAELTKGRYPAVKFDPSLRATGVEVPGVQSSPSDVLLALSVGTKDHLATLVRLAIALQLESSIVLDDHLVHTDLGRLAWFRDALRHAAAKTQVVVLTCRPLDYVGADALPTDSASKSLDSDATRVIDLARVIKRR